MKKFIYRSLIILVIIAGAFFLSPQYFQRALIYQLVDIDDYHIFPNRIISTDKPHPWPTSTRYNTMQLSAKANQAHKKYQSVAFLVLHHDSILFESYWDEYNKTSISNSFSAAKSIVSLLIGCAIDDGFIQGTTQYVADFVPEITGKYSKALTIENVLTMSSGMDWNEAYSSPFSLTTQAYYGNDITRLITNRKITEQPGIRWNYLSGNTQLLALILERATHQKLSDYASGRLWNPLEAEHPALWSLDTEHGTEKAYCCFNSTARDFARLGSLVLHQGQWKGRRIISSQYITKAIQPASFLKTLTNNSVDFYGYQWWITQYKNQNIPYARGILGQYIFILPEMDAVIVRLGHSRDTEQIHHTPLDVTQWLDIAYEILKE